MTLLARWFLILCLALAGAAFAQDAQDDAAEADAAAEEAAPEPLPEPVKAEPRLLDEGLAEFYAGDFRGAAPLLFAYADAAPQTDENRPWAQYFLARSLRELGLNQAAAFHLARVARERANPQVLPKALEELRVLTELPHDEVLIDEQIFGSLDLAFLPAETGAYAHYQQGLIALRVGNERWAENHFSRLDSKTPESSRARYAVVVTRLRHARAPDDAMIGEFLELSKDPKLSPLMRNEALMAVARLRYEKQDYEGALAAYQLVELPPLDPGQATLYLEEAWTRYQLGQLHAAMGLLTALEAPSFRDAFVPDKYLLRAFIYRDLCHYLPAKRAARELTRRFADSLEAIRARTDLTFDVRLRRAAVTREPTRRAYLHLEALQSEGERLGRYAGSFGKPLFAHLGHVYDLARAEAERVFRLRLEEAVRREADTLLRAEEQVRLMDYEVGLKLYERVKRGSKLASRIEEEGLRVDQVAFPFGGEYWNDELRSYRFSLQSRCVEDAP